MFLASSQSASAARILIPLAAGLIILSTGLRGPAQAETKTFVVNNKDGYGLLDCLVDGVACGKTVADAWCESHGQAKAVAYGLASDITGSTGQPGFKPKPDDVVITCKD